MTSNPEEKQWVQSPPYILILSPWFFCHHPLSTLSSLFLTLVLVLSVVTASQLVETGDTFLRNTALPYPYLYTTGRNMPSESSSKAQQRNLKETLRRTLLSESSPILHSSSPYLLNKGNTVPFENINTQKQVSSMAAEVASITKPSVHQTQLTSSDISEVFEGTKYFTHDFNFKKDINYSEMQDKATVISVPAENDVPKLLNNHMSSLPSKNIFKPGYVSSQMFPSEVTVTPSHTSLFLESSIDFSSAPYPREVQSSEFLHENPSPSPEEVLCKKLEEDTIEAAGSNTDLNSINSSNLSLSLASYASSDMTSLTETESEGRFEYSTSSVSVHISQLSENERRNSSKTNAVSKSLFLANISLLSEPTKNLQSPSSEKTSFDSVNMSESARWSSAPFKNQIYRTNIHKNSSVSTPRTLTQMKSLSLVSTDKMITSKISSSLTQRSVSQGNDSSDHLERITVLGLFEMTTRTGERAEGHSELAAARLAVSHINERRLLPGYQLELITNDTKCDPGVGVDAFFHALYTQKSTRMIMLLGTACSEVTESLAKMTPYWNIVQVSFGSTSPVLSDRQEFPLFYRTVAPDSSHNPARLAFVRGFGWDTVTALSQNEDVYSLAVNDLVTELERANITCRATITFAESDFKDQLRMLRDLDTRIIIGSFSHEVAPKIFCEAHHLGMYGSDYAWILQGGPSDIWWENVTECPQHHLAAAVEGLLLVSSHNSIVGAMPSYSGLTNARFLEEFELLSLPVTRYAPQTYDAVWAMALAMSGAQQNWKKTGLPILLHQFDYSRRDMTAEFLSQLQQLEFLGVSGPVSFSEADRVGISAFYQVQGGEVSKVALFHPSSDHMDYTCPDCRPLVWQGGQVPIDKRVCKLRVVTIEPAAFLSITCLALIGITLAFAFLAFNLHFRKLKYIKLSSPRLNNIAVVGCILVYTAVILLGLDHATLPTNTHFSAVCTARVYLLSAGFSLAFGSMFTKTYRVHRIFTRSHSGVVKNKLLQDTQLISLICVLLLIDGLIVTLWVIIDPIQRHLRNLTLEISASDRSVVYQPQVEVCRSQYTHGWLGALYGYKGLLLIVGVYMAWETRHVKIPALNDSQYIGMSVYSVVITSAIVVVLANLISERATLAFVTITTLILTSTTATLCLLFLPKLHAIFGHADDNGDPIMHSMGLKIEYNTRRFVTDDRRELYYRVEVQNRVYRREIAALDLEIGRLKRQLIESPNASSDSMSEGAASKKTDLSPEERGASRKYNVMEMLPSPIVGGGLPLLLLSVLPPVIPRASWPSADHGNLPMRRQVTFSSEPKLDDSVAKQTAEKSAKEQEYYIICDSQDSDTETSGKPGVFSRLKNFLGSRPSSRKTSAASFSGTSSGGGIASALRVHMGYLAGLVPNSNMAAMTSSCNTSIAALNQYGLSGGPSSKELHPLKSFCGRVGGGSGPIISVTSNDEPEENTCLNGGGNSVNRRKFSLGMCLSHKEEKDFGNDERRVSYSSMQKEVMQHQHSQPILSFRERAKGSPRFPHRIVPTCSLNALEDRRRSSSSAAAATGYSVNASGSNPSYLARHHLHVSKQTVGGHSHMGGKCRSLEDATSTGVWSSSASAGVSNWKPRASSYSPNCDVWATAEFGIPLSELGNSGRCRDKNVPQSVQERDPQCSQVPM